MHAEPLNPSEFELSYPRQRLGNLNQPRIIMPVEVKNYLLRIEDDYAQCIIHKKFSSLELPSSHDHPHSLQDHLLGISEENQENKEHDILN